MRRGVRHELRPVTPEPLSLSASKTRYRTMIPDSKNTDSGCILDDSGVHFRPLSVFRGSGGPIVAIAPRAVRQSSAMNQTSPRLILMVLD